ncbi:MAG: redoxin domain-containing protein [Deltaproteobacteria bacterium]|nr:redoxin domain-containing protein [Deltaproteobacteria bacterium]
MEKRLRRLVYTLIVGICLLLAACAMSTRTRAVIRPIALTRPTDYRQAAYLGFFSAQKSFRLTDIEAQIVVLEVFQAGCSHCRDQVADLKELYHELNEAGLSSQIKIIGLGFGEELAGVEEFGRRQAIPYPLFADPLRNKVRVKNIPVTFILALNPEGARVLYEYHGLLPGTEALIKLMRQELDS